MKQQKRKSPRVIELVTREALDWWKAEAEAAKRAIALLPRFEADRLMNEITTTRAKEKRSPIPPPDDEPINMQSGDCITFTHGPYKT